MLEKILHVEDEPDIQEVARMTMEAIGGFKVHSCSSGAQAIAEAPGFEPDLILLDVMMPNMDGPTTLTELRKIPDFADIPVIFMTAKIQSNEVDQYLAMGAAGVIAKPFDPMSFCDEIRQIWDGRDGA